MITRTETGKVILGEPILTILSSFKHGTTSVLGLELGHILIEAETEQRQSALLVFSVSILKKSDPFACRKGLRTGPVVGQDRGYFLFDLEEGSLVGI